MNRTTAGPSASAHLVELRRDLHRHPELRFAEHRTAGILAERLEQAGYVVRRGVGGTGVVGTWQGVGDGPHVVLRADMDAMPVADTKPVAYASVHDGVSHACGHDVHMVVILGVAERLAADPAPVGRLTILFQPAEERPFGEPSGAAAMLAAGAIDGPAPTAIIGLHCWPELPAGSMGVDRRVAMAAKDAFSVRLRGRAAHAATPSPGRDAVLGVAELITALHQHVARARDPHDVAAFNVGTVSGGRSQSVVADEAEITGTLRTLEPVVRARLRETVERTVDGVATAADLVHQLRWADEMPPVLNDPALVTRALRCAASTLGQDQVHHLAEPPMTADDFALYGELGPSLYLKLGVAGSEPAVSLHSAGFDVDERCIGTGVAVLETLTRDVLAASIPAADGAVMASVGAAGSDLGRLAS
ncbi:MAG: amidohydrolase [Chloroflexi bacterium]|nr:amidohydrolase [Chloroflexota bacterium]